MIVRNLLATKPFFLKLLSVSVLSQQQRSKQKTGISTREWDLAVKDLYDFYPVFGFVGVGWSVLNLWVGNAIDFSELNGLYYGNM